MVRRMENIESCSAHFKPPKRWGLLFSVILKAMMKEIAWIFRISALR
jgi:hypothetical protein